MIDLPLTLIHNFLWLSSLIAASLKYLPLQQIDGLLSKNNLDLFKKIYFLIYLMKMVNIIATFLYCYTNNSNVYVFE